MLRLRPLVGRTTPTDCWSMDVMSRADASALKTMPNRPVGTGHGWWAPASSLWPPDPASAGWNGSGDGSIGTGNLVPVSC